MSRTDQILANLLSEVRRELRKHQPLAGLKEAAEFLTWHEWEEVSTRKAFFGELAGLLRSGRLDRGALLRSFQVTGQTIAGGHESVRAQNEDFLQSEAAESLMRQLLGDGSVVPAPAQIDSFVEQASTLAFHAPNGQKRRSNAAKFASMLLTAAFPENFVDFVHEHWAWAAENLDLGPMPAQRLNNYGERLCWAGQAAQRMAHTPTFQTYFTTPDVPHTSWLVAGLVYLLSKQEDLKALVTQVREALPNGVNTMDIQAEGIWQTLTDHNPQVILQGPPGSGKTYLAERVIEFVTEKEGRSLRLAELGDGAVPADCHVIWDVVQFHSSYSYEDFVRGLATVPTDRGILFEAQDRILARAARVAAENNIPVILILDEINRADLARVLGELIYGLERDRRGLPVWSQYGIGSPPDHTLRLPHNLYLIGTMNTADRSIALVDYAIRRRFSFFSVPPSVETVSDFYAHSEAHGGNEAAAGKLQPKVVALYQAVYDLFNNVPNADDIRIGHSYFLVKGIRGTKELTLEEWADAIAFRFAFEVVPMLAEYRKERCLDENLTSTEVAGTRFSLEPRLQAQIRSQVQAWLQQG